MEKIKLFKLGELEDGTQRFQSPLYIGKNTADFVMGNDNIMRCWGRGNRGFDFYEYQEPYEIIDKNNENK